MGAFTKSIPLAACALTLAAAPTMRARAADAPQPVHWLRSIPLDLAREAANAALEECRKQGRRVSVGVVDHNSKMIVLLVDDNASEEGLNSLSPKLHMSTLLQATTEGNVERAKKEGAAHPEIGEENEIVGRFNENFLVRGGAVAFRIGGDYLGSLAVGGADEGTGPGSEAACANAGLERIKDRLK